MCRLELAGAVMITGDQLPAALGLRALQVALPEAVLTGSVVIGSGAMPQVYPHIGTACPSGSTACVGVAVRSTLCAIAAPLAARRTEAASPVLLRAALNLLSRMFLFSFSLNSLR